MKHISITCDCCKNVLEESTDKKFVQACYSKADSMEALNEIRTWQHVCPTCFSSLRLRIKQIGSLSEQITNESKEKHLLEKALERASFCIQFYSNFVDMAPQQFLESGKTRADVLSKAREYETEFKLAIKEIKKFRGEYE